MSDDRNRLEENDEPGTENEDVEAHGMQPPGGLEPPGRSDDDGDDVEAHGMQPPGRLE
jgi:hypothetical protein